MLVTCAKCRPTRRYSLSANICQDLLWRYKTVENSVCIRTGVITLSWTISKQELKLRRKTALRGVIDGHVARMEEMRNANKIIVGKRQRKSLIERLSIKWEDRSSIKMTLRNRRVWTSGEYRSRIQVVQKCKSPSTMAPQCQGIIIIFDVFIFNSF
jgi:hypothetical protein